MNTQSSPRRPSINLRAMHRFRAAAETLEAEGRLGDALVQRALERAMGRVSYRSRRMGERKIGAGAL
jgi:hypothetical protein